MCKCLQLDYFQWNFLFGFIYIALLLTTAVGIAYTLGDTSVRLASLPLPLLTLQISSQLVLGSVLVWLHAKYPFRVSSMAKGALVRPGAYTILEDVVASMEDRGCISDSFWIIAIVRIEPSKPFYNGRAGPGGCPGSVSPLCSLP
jgi:membrane protein implicated in regulation of membrane protease activity